VKQEKPDIWERRERAGNKCCMKHEPYKIIFEPSAIGIGLALDTTFPHNNTHPTRFRDN
jgi:hypothetical protein